MGIKTVDEHPKTVLLIVTLIGVTLSVLICISFYEKETAAIALDFRKDVNDKAAALDRELLLNLEVLYTLEALFETSEEVSYAAFNQVATNILARHNNIQAMDWIPKVRQEERAAYEIKRLKEVPSFKITERDSRGLMIRASERDTYFPVYYVEPLHGNELALGFDLLSDASRRKTLEISRDTGEVLATSKIILVQDSVDQNSFLTFIPVYRGHPVTIEKRRENIRGFILGVFRIADIFDSAIKRTAAEGINISLVDVTDSFLDTLYVSNLSGDHDLERNSGFRYHKQLAEFGGRQWEIIATPTLGYIMQRRSLFPYLTGLFGSFFVILCASYTLSIIQRTAQIKAMVIEKTKDLNHAKQQLEEMLKTDRLTDISNRRCFDEYIEIEWKRAIRDKSPISIIMIDIDHFKLFNDTYGHIAGDECLKSVAHALKGSCNRAGDLVARYGGEEFVAILPNTQDAKSLAEKCRENVENLQISHEASLTSNYVTVSLGISTVIPTDNSPFIAFTRHADRALYKAKETGRNKVCEHHWS